MNYTGEYGNNGWGGYQPTSQDICICKDCGQEIDDCECPEYDCSKCPKLDCREKIEHPADWCDVCQMFAPRQTEDIEF